MKKPRILLVNKYFSPVIGGIETHVKDIADNLCSDFDVRVLVCNTKNVTVSYKVKSYKVHKVKSIGKLFSMPVSFEFFKYFRELSASADIIHLHHPFPLGEIACLMNKSLLDGDRSKKIIVTWHSDILKQKFFMFFYYPMLMKFLYRVDKIIVASPNMAANSPYLKGFQNKIEVVPYGIDIEKAQNSKLKTQSLIRSKFAKNKKLILSVGRLVYYKGYEYLIEAMKDVDANLLIIGSGPLKKNLKLKIKNLKLENKVFIIDPVSDKELISYYQLCDIFVLPSIAKTEAFGIVQLEAMAAGKPVINTNLPTGVPWVSVNNVTGLTVKPKSSKVLAEAINKLINNSGLRVKFGKNALDRIKNYFKIKKMVKNIKNIYTKVLN